MIFSYTTAMNANTAYVSFTYNEPALPTCSTCGVPLVPKWYRVDGPGGDGRLYCEPHAHAEQQRRMAANEEALKAQRHQRLTLVTGALRVLFDTIPANRRRALYRALSTVLHPDQGGDTEMMALLNSVRDQYREKDAS